MTTLQIRNDAMVELLRADFYSREDHVVLSDDMFIELDERPAVPALPAADRIRVFSRDDGAGNSQLCFIDNAGNVVCSGGGVAAPHNILSATHLDAAVQAVSRGSLIYGDATPDWNELVIGGAATFLRSDGVDPSWSAIQVTDLPAHDLLSAQHGDTVVQAVSRGSLIRGDATPDWNELVIGPQYAHLESDGVDVAWQANLTMADDAWIGLGAAAGRLVFDSTPVVDQVQVANADLNFVTESHGIIHVDGVSAGPPRQLLIANGTRYVPGTLSVLDLPAHYLLSDQHADTNPQAVSRGSLIYGTAVPNWDELVIGAAGTYLRSDGNDPAWSAIQAADLAAHNLLSAQHGDTNPQIVSRGSLIYGNAVPDWDELTHPGGAGYALVSLALDLAWDQTPAWTGQHTFGAGWLLSGGVADLDGIADALVLDGDGDTTISAPTDDQIDIEIAGADDFSFTANAFNVLGGSYISETGIRATLANAVGLYVPWLSGDADTTAYFGSMNASNDQIAVEAHSYSDIGVSASSETADAMNAISVSGRGGYFQSTSSTGLQCQSSTGIGFVAQLAGAGTAIAQFQDNGGVVFEIDDGGNVGLGGATAATDLLVLQGADVNIQFLTKDSEHDIKFDAAAFTRIIGKGSNTTAANNYIAFRTNAGERMRIDASGHVYPGANKTQDLGLTGTRWRTLYQGTSTAAGTSRVFESTRDCPLCSTHMVRGTGSLCILGEDRDYEVAHCPDCGVMAVEEMKHLPAARLAERRPPPKVEFLGIDVFPMSGNSRKVQACFRYVDGEDEVINSTFLGETELADLMAMDEATRRTFLLELGRREWEALEELRIQEEEVATLQGTLDILVKEFVGVDLLQ